jgi:hypothetical protein
MYVCVYMDANTCTHSLLQKSPIKETIFYIRDLWFCIWMQIRIHIYLRIYVYTCLQLYVHTYIYVYSRVCLRVYLYKRIYVCI